MTLYRQVVAQIHRLGQEATVKTRQVDSKNEFNNPTDSYTEDRTVVAVRTYPNRNTEVERTAGDRHRDHPIFVVPKGDDHPAVPGQEDHLVYDGTEYEVKALTHYDTHVEFFGQVVRHSEAGT